MPQNSVHHLPQTCGYPRKLRPGRSPAEARQSASSQPPVFQVCVALSRILQKRSLHALLDSRQEPPPTTPSAQSQHRTVCTCSENFGRGKTPTLSPGSPRPTYTLTVESSECPNRKGSKERTRSVRNSMEALWEKDIGSVFQE